MIFVYCDVLCYLLLEIPFDLNLCAFASFREIFFCMTSRLFSKVLLTNDDGFDAPGLRTLTEVAEELAEEVWIVAPNHDQSGTSHSLSLHSPLRISQKDERKYSVSGTQGDCGITARRNRSLLPPHYLGGAGRRLCAVRS